MASEPALNSPRFNVRLLGPPRIEGADGPLRGAAVQRHRLALIALLAGAPGHVLTREKLIGLLWPETSSAAARQLLNTSVYALRTALGDDVLVSAGDLVRLDPSSLAIDVLEFEAALDGNELERAVRLYAGPYLDGFALPDAEEFEHRVEDERYRLERRFLAALEKLAAQSAAVGDDGAAIHWYRERLVRTPADARLVLRLMEVLETAGDRAGALQVAEAHAALVRREFEAEADPDVQAFAARLRSGDPSDVRRQARDRGQSESRASGIIGSASKAPPGTGGGSARGPLEQRAPLSSDIEPPGDGGPETRTDFSEVVSGGRRRERLWLPAAFAVVVVAATAAVTVAVKLRTTDPAVSRVQFLTTLPGFEADPDISPHADRVAFAWDGGEAGPMRIHVMSVQGGDPVRLTDGAGEDAFAAWAPDGHAIAFVRSHDGGDSASSITPECCQDVMIVPALGGLARRITSIRLARPLNWAQTVDWSSDGKSLAIVDRPNEGALLRIFSLSVETGERRQLTGEPPGASARNHTHPAYSPDGRMLAFVSRSPLSGGRGWVTVQDIESQRPARVLSDETWIWDLDWAADGTAVIIATGDPSDRHLLLVPLQEEAEPQPLMAGSGANSFSISFARGTLVYAEEVRDHDIWRIPGPSAAEAEEPRPLIRSTRDDFMPDISPDGRRLAFVSAREGTWDLWVADADGARSERRTSIGNVILPRWSPDGQTIAFSSLPSRTPNAASDAWTIASDGAHPVNVTQDEYPDGVPAWSPDGHWIYFQSRPDSFGWQLRRMPAAGGPSEFVLHSPVLRPYITRAGEIIYYVPLRGIWKADEGETRPILADVDWWTEWTVWNDRVVYIRERPEGDEIAALDIETGESVKLATVPRTLGRALRLPGANIAVAPDGSWIAYTVLRDYGSDLRLAAQIH